MSTKIDLMKNLSMKDTEGNMSELQMKMQQALADAMNKTKTDVPAEVKRRINALKNVEMKKLTIESKFYEELHHLECKYATMFEPMIEERRKIICGEYEPTDEEAVWKYDTEDNEENEEDKENDKKTLNDITNSKQAGKKDDPASMVKDLSINEKVKGIPEFWLATLQCFELTRDMLQEYDEPVLKHLIDMVVRMHDTKPYGFTIEFHFEENEYFTNRILTKSYELTTDINEHEPLTYEGPLIYKCTGCTIDWAKGKNVTVAMVQKKQKHKNSGSVRVINKEEKRDSFFNFFTTPTSDGFKPSYKLHRLKTDTDADKQLVVKKETDNEEEEDSLEDLCEADFEIGHFLKEVIIPKAVLYYTGEMSDENFGDYDDEDEEGEDNEDDDDDDDDEDDEDEDEDEEEDDDDDDEEDHLQKKKNAAPKKKAHDKSNQKLKNSAKQQQQVNDCKQN